MFWVLWLTNWVFWVTSRVLWIINKVSRGWCFPCFRCSRCSSNLLPMFSHPGWQDSTICEALRPGWYAVRSYMACWAQFWFEGPNWRIKLFFADIEQRNTSGARKKWLSSGKCPPRWKTVRKRASPCLTQCAKLSLAAAISRRLAGKAGTGFHEPATASPRYGQPGKQKNTNKAWQQ